MNAIVSVRQLSKTYAGGVPALNNVSLEIEEGEILALLGPNGAGKTTLISMICGIASAPPGHITVAGFDAVREFRAARRLIGLVPQELTLEPFGKVFGTVEFSRGLFGCASDPGHLEGVLKRLSLWDKRDAKIIELSGGMKRRVLIAKALAHEPRVLFLDEPTAGVDVELRRDMWDIVRDLKGQGVTIILTTHYIEEAEAIADRIGIISKGEILLVEDKAKLMQRMGQKRMRIELQQPLGEVPASLSRYRLERSGDGCALTYTYDTTAARTGIATLLGDLAAAGILLRDVSTQQDSLEDIFVGLVSERP